jgi:hypothetical protein
MCEERRTTPLRPKFFTTLIVLGGLLLFPAFVGATIRVGNFEIHSW